MNMGESMLAGSMKIIPSNSWNGKTAITYLPRVEKVSGNVLSKISAIPVYAFLV